MHHDEDADGAGGEAPAVLEHVLLLPSLRVLEGDVEHLAEVLAEVVGGGALDAVL